jgi:hypothetical protein
LFVFELHFRQAAEYKRACASRYRQVMRALFERFDRLVWQSLNLHVAELRDVSDASRQAALDGDGLDVVSHA